MAVVEFQGRLRVGMTIPKSFEDGIRAFAPLACTGCGEKIPPERRLAILNVSHCAKCQREIELCGGVSSTVAKELADQVDASPFDDSENGFLGFLG